MATISPQIQAVTRYSTIAVWLHWIIAALIVTNLLLGLYHEEFERPVRAWIMFFHRSIGIAVLVLIARAACMAAGASAAGLRPGSEGVGGQARRLRPLAVLRAADPDSALRLAAGLDQRQAVQLVRAVRHAAYCPFRGDDAHDLFEEAHEIMGKAMIGLIVLHVAGALKHHFEGHRHLIGRMAPWVRP